jgi:hypothetical protein
VNVQADDGAGAGADGPPGGSPRLHDDGSAGEARVMLMRIRQSMVMRLLLLLLAGWLAAGPARAEAAREWERLPDGRVVIEIYGRRFAFPTDMPAGQVVFVHGQRPHRTRPGGFELRQATLQDVIADRAAAEAWWAPPNPTMPVGITIASRLIEPLLFEGPAPVDRNAVRLTPAFQIWVYRDPNRTFCGSTEWEMFRRDCEYFLARSRDEVAIGSDGFVVERPPFLRGTSKTYYVFPERERRALPGDTAVIECLEFPGSFFCESGTSGVARGPFLRTGILLNYTYSMSKTNRQDMRRIDDAFRAFFARHFIEDQGAER